MVLAESCTAGQAAAALGAIPGISDYFCGSLVAYRERAKIDLLGVRPEDIRQWTSVSEPVAAQMAQNALLRVVEADYSASITGHLGPDAPMGQDGLVFVGLAWRDSGQVKLYQVVLHRLVAPGRLARRVEATDFLCHQLANCVEATTKKA